MSKQELATDKVHQLAATIRGRNKNQRGDEIRKTISGHESIPPAIEAICSQFMYKA